MSFKDKTVFITGASRGIGHAIGLKLASRGANIVIAAKSVEEHSKLKGTIYSAAIDMKEAGGRGFAFKTDIRFEDEVAAAVEATFKEFGGIDILVNNASAIALTATLDTEMKRFDLMQQINARGTFMVTKYCLPYLLEAANPHVLNISPPLNLDPRWFEGHMAYTMAKYGMSLCVLGMAREFKGKVAFNALWPQTVIATAAVANIPDGEALIARARTPQIVADAAEIILRKNAFETDNSGNFFIDEQVLKSEGITALERYQVDATFPREELQQDFFL